MTNIPLKLRLGVILGAAGCAIGVLAASLLGAQPLYLALGIILGCAAGFITGFGVGGLIKAGESLARAERISSGADTAVLVLGWVIAAAGVIALGVTGWSTPLFLSTLFFLACSLFFTYRRLRTRR